MTVRSPRVLLVHGSWAAGHHPDYIAAVLAALGAFRPETAVTYWSDPGRGTRARVYLREFARILGFAVGGGGVVICQAPTFMDFLAFAFAAALTRWARPVVGLFVLRREVEGLVGGRRYWKTDLLAWLVPWMIRRGWLYPAFDARGLQAHWSPGRGTVLPLPPPGGGAAARGRPVGGPVVALLGAIRGEKGAAHYEAVIRAALALAPDAAVVLHTGSGVPLEDRTTADGLAARWAAEPRVRIVAGHQPPDAYVAMLVAADVVVLPYDPAWYGGGTSGVMHDALSLHRVVLVTPIRWARETYSDHPDVVWLESLEEAALVAGLRAAVDRAMVLRREDPAGTPAPSTFAEAWREAVRAAAATLPPAAGPGGRRG